jgi:hypothetical protein
LRRLCAVVEIIAKMRGEETKIEKGRRTSFSIQTQRPVTDHQQLKKAICAVAISPTPI